MLTKSRPSRCGFTLIELLVVIVVISVLALVIVPKFSNQGRRSKEATLRSNLSLLRSAIATFHTDTGVYPDPLTDLTATAAPAQGRDATGSTVAITASDWKGPYITGSVIPKDSVSGSDFTYSTNSPTVGNVTSSASGTGLDGTAYSTW